MSFFRLWLSRMFPRWRVFPSVRDVEDEQALFRNVFDNDAGHALLEFYLEKIVIEGNPRSGDSGACIAYAAQCAMVADLIRALDKAKNPKKWEPEEQPITAYNLFAPVQGGINGR